MMNILARQQDRICGCRDEITLCRRRAFFVSWSDPAGWLASVRRMATIVVLLSTSIGSAAELAVSDILVRPSRQGRVVVSGSIDNEPTFGVTIMIELVPRPGSVGTVEFTPVEAGVLAGRGSLTVFRKTGRPDEVRVSSARASDMDVVQVGDPWPNQGSFSPFDTDRTNSRTLNGIVDDNGTFMPSAVEFHGTLSVHPIRASVDARGVWDITLSTSRGNSSWEGIPTTLTHATVTVTPKACTSARGCNDGDPCTLDLCEAGRCNHERMYESCRDRRPSRKRGRSGRAQTRN